MTLKVQKEFTFNVCIRIFLVHKYVYMSYWTLYCRWQKKQLQCYGSLATRVTVEDSSMLRVKGSWKPSLCVLTQVNSRVWGWAEAQKTDRLLCGKDCNCGASLYHIDVVGPYCFNTNNIFVYIQSPPVDAVFVFGVCGQCACILHSWQIQLALRPLVVYQNYGFWLGPDSTSILGSGWEGIHTAVTV